MGEKRSDELGIYYESLAATLQESNDFNWLTAPGRCDPSTLARLIEELLDAECAHRVQKMARSRGLGPPFTGLSREERKALLRDLRKVRAKVASTVVRPALVDPRETGRYVFGPEAFGVCLSNYLAASDALTEQYRREDFFDPSIDYESEALQVEARLVAHVRTRTRGPHFPRLARLIEAGMTDFGRSIEAEDGKPIGLAFNEAALKARDGRRKVTEADKKTSKRY